MQGQAARLDCKNSSPIRQTAESASAGLRLVDGEIAAEIKPGFSPHRHMIHLARRFYTALAAESVGIQRRAFKKVDQSDLEFFSTILGSNVVQDPEIIQPYNEDWIHMYKGQSKLLLRPTDTQQISKVLSYCNENNLAVVPVGGRSGLVGGTCSVYDEILLSLEKMNKVRSFDPYSGILVADSGVILGNADEYLNKHGYLFPLDLGAKGSAMLGGVISTNAGGVRLLRYGNLHGSVVGLEVVLADGTIVDALSTMRKDNSGFDVKQLFIGSEGTLGVVTGVSIQCPPLSSAINVAFLALENYEQVQQVFRRAKMELGEILGSFECIDNISLEVVRMKRNFREILQTTTPYYVLIETRGSNNDHDVEKLQAFIENAMESSLVVDGTIAETKADQDNIWAWREDIPVVCGELGGFYTYDLSLPLPVMYDLIAEVDAHLKSKNLVGENQPVIAVCGFGHIGDGNLHILIPVRHYDDRVKNALEPFVFEWVQKQKGSISSEHGIGLQKRTVKHYSRSPEQISIMKMLKKNFDPKGILNPYKYFHDGIKE